MIIIVLFRPLMLCLSKISLLLHIFRFITDEPEIDVEAEKVHSGVGKEAHLTCIVHGEPRPSVSLFLILSPIFYCVFDTVFKSQFLIRIQSHLLSLDLILDYLINVQIRRKKTKIFSHSNLRNNIMTFITELVIINQVLHTFSRFITKTFKNLFTIHFQTVTFQLQCTKECTCHLCKFLHSFDHIYVEILRGHP